MKSEKYQEAIQCYTKAMELDSANAVFPCNRFGLKNPFLLFDSSVFLIVQLSLAHFEGKSVGIQYSIYSTCLPNRAL